MARDTVYPKPLAGPDFLETECNPIQVPLHPGLSRDPHCILKFLQSYSFITSLARRANLTLIP